MVTQQKVYGGAQENEINRSKTKRPLLCPGLQRMLSGHTGCSMTKRFLRLVLVVSIVLISLAGAAASRADVTGSILGVVHDRSQGVVSGAKVVVTNISTNFTQEATSAT